MMMQYRRNRNATRRSVLKVLGYACVAVVLILVDIAIGSPVRTATRNFFMPALTTMHHLTTDRVAAYLVSKETLIKENEMLSLKVAQLEQEHITQKIVSTESERFCALMSSDQEIETETEGKNQDPQQSRKGTQLEKSALAYANASGRVIAYDRIALGRFIVLFNDARRPSIGDYVLDDAGYPLGIVEEVHTDDAVVALLTMAHSTHEVRVGKALAQAHGKMSNTLTINVSQEVEVEVGDSVMHVALNLPLGSIVSIERSPADAQALLYVRPFSRPLEARYVTFIKNMISSTHE